MAGFLGMFDYDKVGPGVNKNEPEKKRIVVFFEIFFRRFWKMIGLNLIYFLFCLPIVTIGPATAGMMYVLRNYSRQRHAFLWSDFIDAFKKNFKQSFIVGICNLLLVFALYYALVFYYYNIPKSSFLWIPFVVCIMAAIILLLTNYYITLMIVSTHLKLRQILRNSFYLMFLGIKQNIITTVIVLAVLLPCILYLPYSLLIIPFLPLSFIGLVVCFNCYPVISKFVIDPYYESRGEKNPEYAYLEPLSEEELLFTDIGSQERPAARPKKRPSNGDTHLNGRGKTIK